MFTTPYRIKCGNILGPYFYVGFVSVQPFYTYCEVELLSQYSMPVIAFVCNLLCTRTTANTCVGHHNPNYTTKHYHTTQLQWVSILLGVAAALPSLLIVYKSKFTTSIALQGANTSASCHFTMFAGWTPGQPSPHYFTNHLQGTHT